MNSPEDKADDRLLTRRQTLKAAAATGATMIVSSAPAAAHPEHAIDSGLSELVVSGQHYIRDWRPPTGVEVVERFDVPSWHVRYENGKRGSLDAWLDDPDRHLVREYDGLRLVTIAASADDMGVSRLDRIRGDGLAGESWVEEVDLDVYINLVEPITPEPADAVALDQNLSWIQEFRADTGSLDDGLAYDEDMPPAVIQDVRGFVNATADDFGGVYPDTSDRMAAIVDTGVEAGPEFEDDLGSTRILDASKNFVDDGDPTVGEGGLAVVDDGNGHGSWCAAAVAGSDPDGSRDGYAPAASVLALKALDDEGRGATSDIVAAIRYAADQGADVVVLSLGGYTYSVELDRAVTYSTGAGSPCVVAAGNDRYASRWVNTPANVADAITVTASTAQAPSEARSAYYHNIDPVPGTTDFSAGVTAGNHVDVIAPGCKVTVETPSGPSELTGTSMAGPQVAGGLLLLQVEDPDVEGDVDEQRRRLTEHAQPISSAGVTEAGSGYLDVKAAVEETVREEAQEDVRDGKAVSRDRAHRSLSNASGGALTKFL